MGIGVCALVPGPMTLSGDCPQLAVCNGLRRLVSDMGLS